MAKPTAVAFEIRYGDDSGAELKVSWDLHGKHDANRIVIAGPGFDAAIEPHNLRWLIEALQETERTILSPRKASNELSR